MKLGKSLEAALPRVSLTGFARHRHMMPHDQPEAALYMFKKWLNNKSLVDIEG